MSIGHFLLTLTTEQEDRVLTRSMRPGAYFHLHLANLGEPAEPTDFGPCLIGTAFCDGNYYRDERYRDSELYHYLRRQEHWPQAVQTRFDLSCARFGIPRVTAAIRNRILSNRARRALIQEVAHAR